MNKLKKIGLSALAGSLVAFSASAEVTVSGGASIAIGKGNDTNKTYIYQNDSISFTVAGETDGGLSVTTSLELDGDAGGGTGGDFDSQSIQIGLPDAGTITFASHGGDTVLGGWDDVMPTAYEEVFALTTNDAGTANSSIAIPGSGNDLLRYDSPSLSGISVHASYLMTHDSAAASTRSSSYSDMGIQIAPEMVEGLSIGYAAGEYDESASVKGVEVSTLWAKYAYGPVTVGYQSSEADGPTTTQDDDSTSWGISYAVSENLSVSYGEHDLDLGSATDAGTDQESSGVSASYTMGGTTINAAVNSTDNVGGVATADEDSFEVALVFAF